MPDGGGPAFPTTDDHYASDERPSYTTTDMSLWDYFAGESLNGCRSGAWSHISSSDVAVRAFDDADAMLAERAKQTANGLGPDELLARVNRLAEKTVVEAAKRWLVEYDRNIALDDTMPSLQDLIAATRAMLPEQAKRQEAENKCQDGLLPSSSQ